MSRRLPAEWEPQRGVLLTWPHPDSDWAPHLERIEPVYQALVAAVAPREPVVVACRDEAHRARIGRQLAGNPAVRLVIAASDDTWIRDYGPLGVIDDDGLRLLDLAFDGWGGKYPAARDDAATRALHATGALGPHPLETHPLVLEGGSIDSDGAGTLLTTERCLSCRSQEGVAGRGDWERPLARLLGADRVLWLTAGALTGDDTDGHVDMLARFCAPDTIAYTACDDPADPDYSGLQAMAAELGALRQRDGRPYRLLRLPIPAPIHSAQGARLPASYANFLIVNDAVLLPVYDDPADAHARRELARAFPERAIVPIPARALIEQNGSVHCATMQLAAAPAGRAAAAAGD